MQKLTVKDFAKRKNVSEKTVYSWVKKDQVNYTIETVQGRSVTYILVPYVQTEVNEVNESVANSNEQNIPLQIQADNTQLLEFMEKMTDYIERAGAVKLLEDSERRTKEEYFKVIQENAILKAKAEFHQNKIYELEQKIKDKEQNPFTKLVRKL